MNSPDFNGQLVGLFYICWRFFWLRKSFQEKNQVFAKYPQKLILLLLVTDIWPNLKKETFGKSAICKCLFVCGENKKLTTGFFNSDGKVKMFAWLLFNLVQLVVMCHDLEM